MISTLHSIIIIRILIVTLTGTGVFGFTTFMFLKLKQDDMIKSIRFNVLRHNKIRLYDNLKQYHQFTIIVDKFSKLINYMAGVIYIYTPLIL